MNYGQWKPSIDKCFYLCFIIVTVHRWLWMTLDARLREQNTDQLRENFVSIYSTPTHAWWTYTSSSQREKKYFASLIHILITPHHLLVITYLFRCKNECPSKTWRTKILVGSDAKWVIFVQSIMCSACEFRERKWRGRKVIGNERWV